MNEQQGLNYPFLLQFGLNESEARVYEAILSMGQAKPREIVVKTGLGRPNVYHVLIQLEQKNLIVKVDGEQIRYMAQDPENLRGLLEAKEQSLKRLKEEADALLPRLFSEFALRSAQPTVRVYEGYEGYKKAIDELHRSSTDILTYVDVSAITGTLVKLDEYFDRGRIKKGIHNRIIVSDSEEAKVMFKEPADLSEVRYIHDFPHQFKVSMGMSSDAIVYFTLRNGHDVALVIQEASIVEMHRQMFEFLWQKAKLRVQE